MVRQGKYPTECSVFSLASNVRDVGCKWLDNTKGINEAYSTLQRLVNSANKNS